MEFHCTHCGETFPPHIVKCTCQCEVCYSQLKALSGCSWKHGEWEKMMRAIYSHLQQFHGMKNVHSHSGNGAHNGMYAFTLTFSPTDGYSEVDLLNAVEKVMNQKSCPVKKYAWYLEYKEEGRHPHIHGIYETESGGRIEAKHFKRAWPIWDEKQRLGQGHRGGYHSPVISDDSYLTYIAKDSGIHKSKGFD